MCKVCWWNKKYSSSNVWEMVWRWLSPNSSADLRPTSHCHPCCHTAHESMAGFVTNLARASKGFLKIKKKVDAVGPWRRGPSKRQQFIPSILRRPWATSWNNWRPRGLLCLNRSGFIGTTPQSIQLLWPHSIQQLEHLPYWPDLVPADFFLFTGEWRRSWLAVLWTREPWRRPGKGW